MKREQKEIFIKNLKTIIGENSLILVFHYRGMSMNEMTDLRVQSFNTGCNIKVTNNRLAKLALKETDKVELSNLFKFIFISLIIFLSKKDLYLLFRC